MADRYKVVLDPKTDRYGIWDINKSGYAFGTNQLTKGLRHKKKLEKQASDMNREWERIKREGKG